MSAVHGAHRRAPTALGGHGHGHGHAAHCEACRAKQQNALHVDVQPKKMASARRPSARKPPTAVPVHEEPPPSDAHGARVSSKSILLDFAETTSVHGVPHIGRASTKCMAVFWAIVCLVALGLLIYQLLVLFERYLQYEVTVVVKLAFAQLPFPAVTVCDLNPAKVSHVSRLPETKHFLDAYECAAEKLFRPEAYCYDEQLYDFHKKKDMVALQTYARDMFFLTMAKMHKGNLEEISGSHRRGDFVKSCSFNSKDCDEDDFEARRDSKLGMCFTYNGKAQHKHKRMTARAGSLYGLRLVLKTNVSEYLPFSQAAGVRVQIHSQTQEPFPDVFGYDTQVGTATSLAMFYRTVSRKGPPYSQCSNQPPHADYAYSNDYSTEGCMRDCFQRAVLADCSCYDPNIPTVGRVRATYKPCDPLNATQRGCWQSRKSVGCKQCVQPCEENVYDITVSMAKWPSESVTHIAQCDNATCIGDYAKNGAMLEIFYQQLNYQSYNEVEAYSWVRLASDFGGQLSLLLGLSAISLIEFIILFGRLGGVWMPVGTDAGCRKLCPNK